VVIVCQRSQWLCCCLVPPFGSPTSPPS
jgi:hypothetical protein